MRVLVQRSSGFHEYRPARGRKKEDRQGLGLILTLHYNYIVYFCTLHVIIYFCDLKPPPPKKQTYIYIHIHEAYCAARRNARYNTARAPELRTRIWAQNKLIWVGNKLLPGYEINLSGCEIHVSFLFLLQTALHTLEVHHSAIRTSFVYYTRYPAACCAN